MLPIKKILITCGLLIASHVGAAPNSEDKLTQLIQSKQCDAAEQFAYKNFKGAMIPYALGANELICRGNRSKASYYFEQSSRMGNQRASQLLAEIQAQDIKEGQNQRASCDKVYGLDAMLDDQAKEAQAVYNSHIERASNESFAATLAGAANQSFAGGMGAGMTASGAPYRARVNDLVAERDSKLRDIRNQQKKLRYENPSCYP